jgi:hypothetical protein
MNRKKGKNEFILKQREPVRPEGGYKNQNRIPDLTKHNSGSCYRNRNIYLLFPILVNPEPEFQFLVPVLEPEIRIHTEYIFQKNYFSPKGVICILNTHVNFLKICFNFRLHPVMIPVFTGILNIISGSYEPEPEL